MNKSKIKTSRKKDLSSLEKINSWLDSHKFLGFFSVLGTILAIGLSLNLIFESLPIPSPYRDINYSFPLYINLFCLVYRLFDYWFLDLSGAGMTIKRFADLFIYLNSIGLIVHLFIGISGKNSKGILPSFLSLDHRYIWFPIATYLVFFTVPALLILASRSSIMEHQYSACSTILIGSDCPPNSLTYRSNLEELYSTIQPCKSISLAIYRPANTDFPALVRAIIDIIGVISEYQTRSLESRSA